MPARSPSCLLGWTLPQNSTVCAAEPTDASLFQHPRRAAEVLSEVGPSDRVASDRDPRSSRAGETGPAFLAAPEMEAASCSLERR